MPHRKLVRALSRLPFRNQLTLTSTVITGTSLIASVAALNVLQVTHERSVTDQVFRQTATVAAADLGRAVLLHDQEHADHVLNALKSASSLLWVHVDGKNHHHFSEYHAPDRGNDAERIETDLSNTPSAAVAQGRGNDFGYVRVPVMLDGLPEGMLTMGYRYRSVTQVVMSTLPAGLMVLALCMAMAMAMVAYLRHLLAAPLSRLNDCIQDVATSGDLKARVPAMGDPDFDPILSSFNNMLDQLEQHNDHLVATLKELGTARDEAEAASVAKSEFLANMSHELRTPLNAVIGYAEVLREDLAAAGQQRNLEDVSWICSSSRQLLDMINALLDLSKIEAGRMELDVHRFELSKLMAEVEGLLRPLAAKHDNQLTVNVEAGLTDVLGDSTKLRQCLLNLGANACKFTREGFITLTVHEEDADLLFQVSDTGIGMSEDELARIFQPFTQSDSSTTRHYGGTGLGLALVDRFATLMHGAITVSSDPGFGSVFTLRVPRDPTRTETAPLASSTALAPAPMVTRQPEQRPERTKPLALVIDDDPASTELMNRMLERAGYTVETAQNGHTGIARALALWPDLILLDLNLPDMDGWTVLDQMGENERLKAIPTVVVSVDDRKTISIAHGASDHLVKPVTAQDLDGVLDVYATHHSGTILLAEDDEATANLYAKGLRQAGFGVVIARDVSSAQASLGQHTFALVVTDLKMPDGDGFALLRAISDLPTDEQPPCIVVTGRNLSATERKILDMRNTAVILKSGLSPRHLVSSVSEVLRAA